MNKVFFNKPYDDGTQLKLELYRKYIRSWLPVFISQNYKHIEILDLFAGPGSDADGNSGSPLITIEEIGIYCQNLKQHKCTVNIILNDINNESIKILNDNLEEKKICCAKKNNCDDYGRKYICPYEVKITNRDFSDIFNDIYINCKENQHIPRFIFLDQFGMKYITKDVFKKLIKLQKTDFMFFISSNHLMRFKQSPEFNKHLDIKDLDFSKPSECHRTLYTYYKSLVDKHGFIGQFSIKKGSAYYGLIFYSNSPLGLSKFIDAAWKIDPLTGETNHDIDDDPIKSGELLIDFAGDGKINTVKKLVHFKSLLIDFLKSPRTNENIYIFALENGISISKTNEILRTLEIENKLSFKGTRRKGAFYLGYKPSNVIMIQCYENFKN